MDTFFNPSSVVVIGSSNSPFNLGATISNILGYSASGAISTWSTRRARTCATPRFQIGTRYPRQGGPGGHSGAGTGGPGGGAGMRRKGSDIWSSKPRSSPRPARRGNAFRRNQRIRARVRHFALSRPKLPGTLNAHNKFCCFFGIIPGMYDEVFDRPGSISYVIQSGGVGAGHRLLPQDITNVNKMVSIGQQGGRRRGGPHRIFRRRQHRK